MFDGVHSGHRHLLNTVKKEARLRGLRPAVVTFSNHPSQVTTPASPVKMLTSPETRTELIKAEGIADVLMMPFDSSLRALTAREFMVKLRDEYGISCLVVGFNNHFGADRTLGFADYRQIGHTLGMDVVQATEVEGHKTSSSIIRRLLESGQLAMANELLGRRYTLSGIVVEGKQLGRTIGFPTANICPSEPDRIIPAPGVYATRLTFADHPGPQQIAMVNIGYRPTVNNNPFDVTIEAHILDFSADIYNRPVTLEFVARLRNEMRFDSLVQLKEQLAKDAIATRQTFELKPAEQS